jgi:hypothetical protein
VIIVNGLRNNGEEMQRHRRLVNGMQSKKSSIIVAVAEGSILVLVRGPKF